MSKTSNACSKCDGSGFIPVSEHDDGSSTLKICECTGITAASLRELCEHLQEHPEDGTVGERGLLQ